MFDTLLQEVAKKFGLGDKAGWILSALLGLMFNQRNGGMSGFLGQLTRGGLGRLVDSWLGKDEPTEISASQFESTFGSRILENLVSKIGLARGPVGMAVAYMLPKVVRALAPDGVIPISVPAALAQYIGADDNGNEQPAPTTEPPQQAQQHIREEQSPEPVKGEGYSVAPDSPDQGSGFNWWWLLLPLILLLGWCTLNQPEQSDVAITQAPEIVPEPPAPTATVPTVNSRLSISNEAERFDVSGTVSDEATKASIFDMLKAAFGADNISGEISVDPAAASPRWLDKLMGILPALKGASGARLNLDGDNIALDGDLDQSMIDSLLDQIKAVFGDGFNISSNAASVRQSLEDFDTATESADATSGMGDDTSNQGAEAIKDMVTSGNATVEDLLEALNTAGINFATGSFNISPDSMAVLEDAAEAIKAAPADTLIEVGGHTDNTGSSELNLSLSGKRAQAVVDALVGMGVDASMLSANGYGDSQPIADNDTEEGRAKNRRMEFTLQ